MKVFNQGPSRFSPELTRISSQKPESLMPNLQRGRPCLNFAHFTMQFCNPSDPKGGPWPNGPPLNMPLVGGMLSTPPILAQTVHLADKLLQNKYQKN